jgi:hypothetical protein
MRGIQVDAPWVAQRRLELQTSRRDPAKPCQVTLTFHADLAVEKKDAVEAVRAQIAERLNIPSDTVRVLGEPVKGSVKFTLEFENADDAARLLAQVQAGNEHILSLFHRWSARREEFLTENKEIHFHGSTQIHGSVAVAEDVTQTITITTKDAALALAKIEELVAKHVQDGRELAEARKHLGGAQAEVEEENPDCERVAKRTGRVVDILKKVAGGADWFKNVVESGKTVAEFCGKHGSLVIQAIESVIGS